MKYRIILSTVFAVLSCSVQAQCFNRATCEDPTLLEIRSQISVALPVSDQASSSDTMKAMDHARRDLYAMSNRECDTLKGIFGGDCNLSSVNINSNMQDSAMRNKSAFISISGTYQIKRKAK